MASVFPRASVGPEVKGWVGSTRQTQCPRYHPPACVLRTHMFRGWHVLGWICWGVVVSVGLRKPAGACHGRAGLTAVASRTGGGVVFAPWPPQPAPRALAGGTVRGTWVCCLDTGGLGGAAGWKGWEEGCPKPPFCERMGAASCPSPALSGSSLSGPGPLTALAPSPELGCSG